MIDEEVETVLRQIRERVISQPLAELPSAAANPGTNGDAQLVTTAENGTRKSEALARLNAHLTTTARAWDRLPPVFSNRTGTTARIEVWIKARLKVFSRWFTWEQVNFNAAVHHALGETLKALTEQGAAIRSQAAENEALHLQIQSQRDEIESLRVQLQADNISRERQTSALRAEMRGEVENLRVQTEDQKAGLRAEIETSKTEAAAQLAELAERADLIENEQRVCFKQLSLETNETAVLTDRAQQRVRTLVDELDQRIRQLESHKQKSGP